MKSFIEFVNEGKLKAKYKIGDKVTIELNNKEKTIEITGIMEPKNNDIRYEGPTGQVIYQSDIIIK
jgi:ribosomal protein L21E